MSSARTSHDEPLGLVHALSVVLRYRFSIILLAAIAMALTVGVGLIGARTYSATASFMPQARNTGSNIAGLAAQFGMAVPVGEATQSPAFYAELVTSREILGVVADTFFRAGSDPERDTVSMSTLLKVKESSPAARRAETIRRLKQRVNATATARTGVVRMTVRTPSPLVSQQVATLLIDEVNRFNLQTRQSQAAAERRFTEQRLAEARAALRASEDRLQGFLQANRAMSGSAQLQFTLDRLRRDVSQQQEMFASLNDSYEQAKIEEVRDTPVITVIEHPEVPTRPDPRGLVTRGLLAGLLGMLIAILLAFVRDAWRSSRAQTDSAVAELARLREEAVADLRHPLRAARRALSGEPALH